MRVARAVATFTILLLVVICLISIAVADIPKRQQAGLNKTLPLLAICLLVWLVCLIGLCLPGNHCRRVATKLDEPLEFDALIHAAVKGRVPASKIISTDYDYIYIGQEDSGWVVGHPRYFLDYPGQRRC
jgi:hypothetical protein